MRLSRFIESVQGDRTNGWSFSIRGCLGYSWLPGTRRNHNLIAYKEIAMINAEMLQGQWNEFKGTLKQHWGELTSDDLRRFNGDVDRLVGLIQRKTGETRESVQDCLEELTADGSSTLSHAAETARKYANGAVSSVQDAYADSANRMRERYSDVEDMVRTRPAESVVLAFGAGLLAGVIAGLVMRKR
jgi:uncharacterized protein YjbJ (UPF0337 family)